MGRYVKTGALDWRALEGARASGISYRLANGQEGEIIDPHALRTFYTRVFYADQIKKRPAFKRQAPEVK
jgi:hypothetical protein